MRLHKGQDGVAGCQVTDPDTHEVFAHLRLPEQLIELRREKREREKERERENGQREEMINEAGNELHAIVTSGSNCRRLYSISEEERLPFTSGGAGRKPSGAGCTN